MPYTFLPVAQSRSHRMGEPWATPRILGQFCATAGCPAQYPDRGHLTCGRIRAGPMMCIPSWLCRLFTPEWLTATGTILAAIGTFLAVIVAMLLALYGQRIGQVRFHPELNLDAKVQRPDADKVRRWCRFNGPQVTDLGEYYYFRLAVTNTGNTAANDVQVFLSKVERLNGDQTETVSRFTPMNLIWTNTEHLPAKDRVTRSVLLADTPPVYCDLAHVGEPQWRELSREDLDNVPAGKAVLGLDVEVTTYSKGHLLEPGNYRFSLTLAASNCRSTQYVMEVSFPGEWLPEMEEMFKTGFKMGKPKPLAALQKSTSSHK